MSHIHVNLLSEHLDTVTPETIQHMTIPNSRTMQFDFSPGIVAPAASGPVSVSIPTDNLLLFMQNDTAKQLLDIAAFGHDRSPLPTEAVSTAPNSSKLKCIALTFDDGPSRYTPIILDTLKKHKAHASFFMIGPNVADKDDLVKRSTE